MANAISNITSCKAGSFEEPKFSFVMIVLNGMPFIEYSLKSVYEFTHEIIIVEGAVEKCMFAANPDGSSTDGTVEFIKSFPDTQNKIKVIQGKWLEKCEMQNEALKYVTGDYVWLIDSDEVYKRQDMEKVKALIQTDPSITQLNFNGDNFWKGLDYIFVSPKFFETGAHWRRVFKFVKGASFTTHRPPTMLWPGSDKTTEQMHLVDGHKTRKMGIVPYHYSYVLNKQVKQKIELYNRYNWGDKWGINLLEWYNECFLKWTPKNREQIEARYPVWTGDRNSRTQTFTGTHPKVMESFKKTLPQKDYWKETFEDSGKTTKQVKIAADYDQTGAKIEVESSFGAKIQELFNKIRPKKIIETGTYFGTGTTTIITRSLQRLGIDDAMFFTIEVNPQNYARAKQYFETNNLKVNALNGLSVPRAMLPSKEEIARKTITDVDYDGIFVDHKEENRVGLYYNETNFPNLPDNLLYKCLRVFDFKPDFVLLDSGGHMGNIEFNYLIDNLQGECYIALDDIYHVKHHRSFQQIQEDERFERIVHSKEKFGFCIAKFTPKARQIGIDKTQTTNDRMFEKTIEFSKSIPEDKLKNETVSVTIESTKFILQKLGTHYGGWVIPINKISNDSICYCAGAGEDISFDVELVNKFGCDVFIFDPTPRAQAHIEMLKEYSCSGQKMPINNSTTNFYNVQKEHLDKIKFFHYGIWSKSKVNKFFAPRNPEHVSHSILNLQKTTDYFEAQCITIKDVMKHLGHEKVDLLKLDIEGAEYEVVNSLIKDNIEIGILCVEFDELNSPRDQNSKERIEESIRILSEANFVLLFVDGANYTFINREVWLTSNVVTHIKPSKINLPEKLLRRPQYLKIETTNICNANCAFCMYRFMKREKGIMPMELFRKVIDDYVAAGGGALTMSPLVGDCLVDAKLLERLRYCRNFNEITHIGFHTNMISLNRWTDEQILEIIDLIDVWNCSIGPNRDVYKDMFGVDQFERVIANLERFHQLINLSEHKPLVQLNGRAGGGVFEKDERLISLSLAITGKEIKWTTSYMDWGGQLPELPRATKIIKTIGYTNKQSPCMKGLVSSVVFCDGRVGFCGCADYDAILTIGDINKEKLGEILAGQRRQEIMASFGKPWLKEYCQKCSFYQPIDLKWIARWIPGTNPHHPEPVRPSLQRGITPAAKMNKHNTYGYPPINEDKSEIRNVKKNQTIQAQALLDQGHIIKALKEFEEILALSPDAADAHLGRAVCLARLGRLLEAEVEAKNALSKETKKPRLQQFVEQMHKLKPSLTGDRDIEWGSIKRRIKEIAKVQGQGAKLLDFGCGQTAELSRFATQLGYHITAIDLTPLTVSFNEMENIHFIQGDFLGQDWTPQSFDLIINCSSIEHSGLVGRYGVVEEGPDDDLKITARMSRLIKPDGKMLLTIPVGLDKVVGSLHRVYGQTRLAKLLDGWEVQSNCFWIKDENNQWREVDEESALQREPMLAYGLGCFVLRPAVRATAPNDSTLAPIYDQRPVTFDDSEYKTAVNVTASEASVSANPKQPHKVLIVKTDGIGDFVIFSGTLPYYRKLYPSSHISIVVRECSKELAEACPYIDEVIVNHREPMVYDQNYAAEFIKRIRAAKFDVAICPIYSRDKVSDFIVINSGAKEKIVSTGNDSNMPLEQINMNNPYFTKLVPAKADTMLETERNKEFLEGFGFASAHPYETTIWMKQEHKDFADRLLKELNIEKPIVVCPFAQYAYKNWTLQKWAKLISNYKDYPIVISGAAKDIQEAENLISLTNHGNIHNLCGKTTLRQLAAILVRSELCLGVDSGPAHIAAAVNCPQVVIMGGGHFGRFMPNSTKTTLVYNQIDCYGCNWRCKYGQDIICIATISVDMVERAVNEVFGTIRPVPVFDNSKVIIQAKKDIADKSDFLVSAIVSTYNSEKFIRGCLEDLENQTIADKLEIIVINSGSQENEETIVKEFQQRYDNIKYIKTEQREGIYTAWNRAIKVARGTFLTNANTDDRHREDALEVMAETLLANPDVALAYGDQICTDTPNGTFANHHAIEMARRAEYSHERLLFGCCVGSQPMWRKSLHTELGYFDDTLTCAGDWDFWLRISISSRYKFKHIPEFLGLYYYNENGIEHGRKIHSLYERYIVGKRYGNPYISVIPLYTSKDNPLVSVIMTVYNCAEYIGDAIESVLIQNYPKFELIIINDGSTDSTKEVISRYEDQRIRYFYQENAGMSNALNHAVRQARGQYIMPLDADDMMTADFIAAHLAEFEKHPDADLVYCDVLLIDENSKPIRIMNKPEYQDRRHLIRDLFRAGHPVVPFRLCIKRTVYDKIGLYDEKLKVGMDYDMMRRFVKAGLKEHHLSEPLHLRRMHADSLSGNQSAQKAKCHFEVIKRFIDTFAYDELFPDVAWDEIAPQMRQLHAKCLAAGTYLAIGQDYVKTKATECSRTAFDLACSELNDCVKMDPGNQDLRQLLQKSKLIQARYTEAPQQVVYK